MVDETQPSFVKLMGRPYIYQESKTHLLQVYIQKILLKGDIWCKTVYRCKTKCFVIKDGIG